MALRAKAQLARRHPNRGREMRIGIAGTGLTVYRKWLDAVSDNIANINDISPTSGPAG